MVPSIKKVKYLGTLRSFPNIWPYLFPVLLLLSGPVGNAQYRFDQMVAVRDADEVSFRPPFRQGMHDFIWAATNNGLCRFDGREFTYYKNDPEDPHSIFSNDVLTVLPIEDEIWSGTLQGISVLDIHTRQFRNYQLGESGKLDTLTKSSRKNVISLYQDRQGQIWIGTRYMGLWKYDPVKDDFFRFKTEKEQRKALLVYSGINHIEQSSRNDSIIWVATSYGLLEINKYREDCRKHTFPRKDVSLDKGLNHFRRLYYHTDGLLYTSSWSGGINIFNPETKELKPLIPENDEESDLAKYSVSDIIPQSEDEIWFTSGFWTFLYSSRTNRILYRVKNDQKNEKYYGVHLIDKDRRIWYSSFRGVYLYDPCIQQFHTYSWDDLRTDGRVGLAFLQEYDRERDQVIVCPRVTDGLYLFNRREKNWEVLRFTNIAAHNNGENLIGIYGFGKISKDEYILCGRSGVFRLRRGDNRLLPILTSNLPKGTWFSALLIDRSGKLWIGTSNAGLWLVDPATGEYEAFQEELQPSQQHPTRIDIIFEDSRGNIWVKNTGGLSVYIPGEKQLRRFLYTQHPENSFAVVDAFAEDGDGRIWTCSEEGRIGYAEADHPELGIVKKFSIRDSGLEGRIYSLVSDRKGNIWGCSNQDLFQINQEGKVSTHISLKYSNVSIDHFGMAMLPDGQLVIGGRKEITITDPHSLERNDEVPVPYLTQVTVRQKPLQDSYPLFGGAPLELKHNENFFSFSYAAQAYTFAEDVRFRYRLHDLEGWIDAGESMVANYTSVPPGEYTFQLMAANNEGDWNPEILEVPVIIHQAWYKSWWFFTLLGLFFAGMAYALFSFRIQQVRKEEKIKASYEKKLAGVEMSALVSQMNPHFLFNSLNSIDSYIIKNQSFKASEYLNSFARLMRLMLQNSRSTYISLQNEIEGLELYLQMESLRSDGLFDYAIHIDPEVDIHKIEIPPMLIQPYVENAIWHGVRHLDNGRVGRVDISISMEDRKLKIKVIDNGVGREKSAEIQQRKSDHHKRSMGMQITKSRIEMINKLYNADASVVITDLYDPSGMAGGTKVTLTIAI